MAKGPHVNMQAGDGHPDELSRREFFGVAGRLVAGALGTPHSAGTVDAVARAEIAALRAELAAQRLLSADTVALSASPLGVAAPMLAATSLAGALERGLTKVNDMGLGRAEERRKADGANMGDRRLAAAGDLRAELQVSIALAVLFGVSAVVSSVSAIVRGLHGDDVQGSVLLVAVLAGAVGLHIHRSLALQSEIAVLLAEVSRGARRDDDSAAGA